LLCFLISDVGKETLGEGEEKLDDLFTYKEEDEAIYFISEGPGDQKLNVGPFDGAAAILEKGKTATILENESRDVEILGSLKEGNRLLSPLSENQLPGRRLLKLH